MNPMKAYVGALLVPSFKQMKDNSNQLKSMINYINIVNGLWLRRIKTIKEIF